MRQPMLYLISSGRARTGMKTRAARIWPPWVPVRVQEVKKERRLSGACSSVMRGGAGLLAGGGQALAEPCQHQQGRSPPADGLEVRQAADDEGRGAHQQQREHEDLPPAHPVTEVAEDDGADRAGHVGEAEGGEGHDRRVGVGVGEEDVREDQRGRGTEDEEVVVLDGAAQEAGEGCLLRRPGRWQCPASWTGVSGSWCSFGVTTLSRMDQEGLGCRLLQCGAAGGPWKDPD